MKEELRPVRDLEADLVEVHARAASVAQLFRRDDGKGVRVHAHGREARAGDLQVRVDLDLDVLLLGRVECVLQVFAGFHHFRQPVTDAGGGREQQQEKSGNSPARFGVAAAETFIATRESTRVL